MTDIFDQLKAEFPRDAISWRAQTVTKDGTKAMALAYIDARDVMQRLDDVVGPGGWQCRYPHANGKTVCEIGLRVNDEWIWKADGAGDTDIEAEKGALSDAFKRAAVRWGIGRYLYDLASPWVPCESYKRGDKFAWSKWTDDPWRYVRNSNSAPQQGRNAAPVSPPSTSSRPAGAATLSDEAATILVNATMEAARLCADADTLRAWWGDTIPKVKPKLSEDRFLALKDEVVALAATLSEGRAAA
jgi:hypothetical protein